MRVCELFVLEFSAVSLRKRRILLHSAAGGRTCPDVVQTRPCAYQTCHQWRVTPWSNCTVQVLIFYTNLKCIDNKHNKV